MIKKIVFDMDGTIADLYNVPQWKEHLNNNSTKPYRDALPLYNMMLLCQVLRNLKNAGWHISVVTWGSIGADNDFMERITETKKKWLNKFQFPYDEFICTEYGTPKRVKADYSILFDDNAEVRAGYNGATVDATKNIIPELLKLF